MPWGTQTLLSLVAQWLNRKEIQISVKIWLTGSQKLQTFPSNQYPRILCIQEHVLHCKSCGKRLIEASRLKENEYNSCDSRHSPLIGFTDQKSQLPENVHLGPKYDESNIKIFSFILVVVDKEFLVWWPNVALKHSPV